jgi:supervillin
MTVELDREKGPQVRVEQGREPPAFLNLFQGLMFIHLESKEAPLKDAKLYVTMGACENEGHFIEVQCESSSLRSLGSFLLVDFLKGRLYLWHGKLSNSTARKIAINGANKIIEAPHQYLNYHGSLRLIPLEEGEESLQFLSCLNVQNKNKLTDSYACLRDRNPEDYSEVIVFGFSSLQGSFEATPVVSVKRKSDSLEAFPILQEELYSAQQPKLFLISRGSDTWLWQGWTPRGDEENENATTGSGEIRWTAERKAAIETAVKFCQFKGTQGYVIHAGLEPTQFTNIFPYWRVVDEAREANLMEGKTEGLMTPLDEAHQKFLNTRLYTLEELQARPEEVDHSRLEAYLSDEDFENILKMGKEEFKKLQSWKQNELKKAVGLF